jgi:hypothetical protein
LRTARPGSPHQYAGSLFTSTPLGAVLNLFSQRFRRRTTFHRLLFRNS